MSSLLDLPEVHPRLLRWSVDEYESMAAQGRLPKRAELLRGLIIEKMPKSPLHRDLAKALYDQIAPLLPSTMLIFQEAPLRFKDSEPGPDIALVTGERKDFRKQHPTTAVLVVEVAVSSLPLDRAKADMYAEAEVPEYWIVLSQEQAVEVYRKIIDGRYTERQRFTLAETLTSVSVPSVSLELSALFE